MLYCGSVSHNSEVMHLTLAQSLGQPVSAIQMQIIWENGFSMRCANGCVIAGGTNPAAWYKPQHFCTSSGIAFPNLLVDIESLIIG